jgi:hypothetical protein
MEIIRRFEMLEKNLFIQTKSLKDQQDALGKFKDILLSKLATIED